MRARFLCLFLIVGCARPEGAVPKPTLDAGPAAARAAPALPTPPVAPKHPETTTLHGAARTDDYAWMKAKGTKELEEHLAAENRYTEAMMAPTRALRDTLYRELVGRMKETDESPPYRYNGFWYGIRVEAGKEHELHFRKKAPDAPEEIFLDVNALAEGAKFTAVSDVDPSDDNALLAYSVDHSGLREYTLFIKDLKTGALLPEQVPHATSLEWAADSKTLFYTTENSAKRSSRLWRHALGTKVEKDVLVYEEKDERFDVEISRTLDRQLLVLGIASHTTSEERVLDAKTPTGAFRVVLPRKQDVQYDLEHRGHSYFLRINDTGRTFRLVEVPEKDPAKGPWKELIPARPEVMLSGVDVLKDYLVVWERERGLVHARTMPFGNQKPVTFTPPVADYSLSAGANAEFDAKDFQVAWTSMVDPETTESWSLETGAHTVLKVEEVPTYAREQYDTTRLEVTAKDGAKIPVSLAWKKGTPRDGSAPLYLRGYGAYGSTDDVSFELDGVSLMDRGLVLAETHLRGGGDFGRPWHDAGRMMNKKNTFTDFIACAEGLVDAKWTSPSKLVINGASAGGLLMGAVLNLRPDLFKAAFVEVPFVDVVNTMLDESLPLTVSEFEEWGNPKQKSAYEYMVSYSPYDNVRAQAYPAMLVRSSYNDTQVLFHEPAKWVAKLRATKTDANPLLLWMDMEPAGHGGKSGRYESLHEDAFGLGFVLWQLGLTR